MIVHNKVFITDPNYENETAGGGLFVSFDKVSEQSATVETGCTYIATLPESPSVGK